MSYNNSSEKPCSSKRRDTSASVSDIINVSETVSRLQTNADYSLAMELQEKEFKIHYDNNRTQSKQIQLDSKKSREEQLAEQQQMLLLNQAKANEMQVFMILFDVFLICMFLNLL